MRRGWIMRRRDWAAPAKGIVKSPRYGRSAPQLLADITARGLRWQDLFVARARIEGDIKSTDQDSGPSQRSRRADFANPTLTSICDAFDAKGSEKQHQLQPVFRENRSGQLSRQASFDREAARWKGTLSDTRFQTPVAMVKRPARLRWTTVR